MSRNDYTKLQLVELMDKAVSCLSDDYQDVKVKMQAAGFHQLGAGNYGSAWSHHSVNGWCVKVCGRVDGDSYPAYALWGEANPMPGVPEFKYCTFSQQHDVFMVLLPQYAKYECGYFRGASKMTPMDNEFFSAKAACYGHTYDYFGKDLLRDSPVVQAAMKACDFFADHAQWDLHDGNFMVDPELNILVMTDPIHQGDNKTLISMIKGGTPVKQSWGHQWNLDFGAIPGAVKIRGNEFFNLPAMDFNVWEDFAAVEARVCGARMVGGFGNPQQIPKVAHHHGRMLPPGAIVDRHRDEMAQMYIEKVYDKDGRLLAFDRVPFGQGRIHHVDNRLKLAAQWVQNAGLKPHRAEQLAREAQHWPDERLRDLNEVVFANMPSRELAKLDTNPDACAMVPIQHWHVPVDVLRVLRDQYKIRNENAGRLGWGGRFANAVKREVGRFI